VTRTPPGRRSGIVAVALLVLVCAGCGYALAGRGNALPATIRVIGVPDFQNQSSVPDFDRALTDAVREEFQSKGRYTILPQSQGVDGVLVGTILSVAFPPAAFTADQQVSRSLIIVTASIEFREVSTDRVIWANPTYQVRDEYQVSTSETFDPSAILTQDVNARQRIARTFARSVVTSIFEAF
jgi:hypothetical protein